MTSTWPKVMSLAPAGPAVSKDELHLWVRKYNPVAMHIQPTAETDEHGYERLVRLLRDKGCVSHGVSSKPCLLTLLDSMPLCIGVFQENRQITTNLLLTGPP